MTALALELDDHLQKLDPETLKEVEVLFFNVLALVEKNSTAGANADKKVLTQFSKPYQSHPRALGLRSGLSYENVGELLATLEGHDWK